MVGVNTAIATGNTGARGNIGIGFAVPMNTVRNVVSQLIEKGRVEHPFIGVGAQEVDQEIAQLFNLRPSAGCLSCGCTRRAARRAPRCRRGRARS